MREVQVRSRKRTSGHRTRLQARDREAGPRGPKWTGSRGPESTGSGGPKTEVSERPNGTRVGSPNSPIWEAAKSHESFVVVLVIKTEGLGSRRPRGRFGPFSGPSGGRPGRDVSEGPTTDAETTEKVRASSVTFVAIRDEDDTTTE